jgi:glyoxylase-like metal-dependent hydrolase (beta-lactamase superfamily II)
MNYQIVPLNVGDFEAVPKTAFMYQMYRDVNIEAPCIMWYLKGTKNNIIVDLGPADPEQCLQNHGRVIRKTAKQQPVNALKSIGLTPDDIKLVVMTHLHWDHGWGFHLFKNAKFFIQRKEIAYAVSPPPCFRSQFYEDSLGKPQVVDYLDRVEIVEGDYEIEDGVSLVHLPGHTPGFQGVSVRTVKGHYLIAGDTVALYECWEQIPHVPSGIFNNLDELYASMGRIEKMADFILPGHDKKVFEKTIYP